MSSEMIRVMIKWEPPMKLLQVAQGVLSCEKQVIKPGEGIIFEELFACKVKIENGSHSYSGIKEGTGIPSILFNRIKDKLEIMLKSYHDGLKLSDCSVLWIQDDYYYVVTTLYSDKNKIPRTRNVAILKEEIDAIDVVVGNYGDIHETNYDYALIEQLQPGLYPNVLKESWFKWNDEKERYIGCERPREFAHIINFTIG